MPGFICILTEPPKATPVEYDLSVRALARVIEETSSISNTVWAKRFVVPKFMGDKLFSGDHDIFICTDGVLVNSHMLRDRYAAKDNFDLIKKMYELRGRNFVDELRGDFTGFLYDRKTKSLHAFTNHVGSKTVFYFFDKRRGTLILSSELKMVAEGMRQTGYKPELDEQGAYCLLTFGWMLEDITLLRDVHRLTHGSVLTFDGNGVDIYQYYHIRNMPFVEDSDDRIISELDERFRNAIKAEYEKDIEYGYRHILTLSGGLDSRMNLLFAQKLGYQKILSVTFSQNGHLEERIAKQVASDWGVDYLFYALDNGNYLKNIDDSVFTNDGLILFSGSAHLLAMLKLIDFSHFGLLHTGLQGDPIVGETYLDGPEHTHNKSFGATSKFLTDKVRPLISSAIKNYENDEIFKHVNRGTNGMLNMYRVSEQFSEFSSPFMHVDFMDYSMRIHPRRRYKARMYIKWMLKMAPEMAEHPWEKRAARISANEYAGLVYRYYKAIRKRLVSQSARHSMNPFDFWYRTNGSLQQTFDRYFNDHIHLLDGNPEVSKDARRLYDQGIAEEKTMPLTLLAAMKVHGL